MSALLAVIVCGVLTAAPVWAGDVAEAEAEDCSSEMDIFLQEGASGSLVEDGAGGYTLTISDVLPYTVYFSDRPAMDSGFIPLDKYIDGFNWNPAEPPNAAIILREEDDEQDIVIAQLTDPRYDEEAQTLQYSIKILEEFEARSQSLQEVAPHADESIPDTFGSVLVVIDGCLCWWNIAMGDCDSDCYSMSWHWTQLMCNYDGGCCEKCYIAPEPSPEP